RVRSRGRRDVQERTCAPQIQSAPRSLGAIDEQSELLAIEGRSEEVPTICGDRCGGRETIVLTNPERDMAVIQCKIARIFLRGITYACDEAIGQLRRLNPCVERPGGIRTQNRVIFD